MHDWSSNNIMNIVSIFRTIGRNPSLIIDIMKGKSREQLRAKVRQLNERRRMSSNQAEIDSFISAMKKRRSLPVSPAGTCIALNKLCCLEDWENEELKEIIFKLQSSSYYNKVKGVLARQPGLIHRKDWEWGLGIIAMDRLGKLNRSCRAIGIGVGKEIVLFYLANKLGHVFATDLYDKNEWNEFAPPDFPENPQKYAPFPYREDALTVLRMDGTKLEFPSESFDIAFSFSSIEHFGGENHLGALKSLKEMSRVLKSGGIAIVATDFIINNKDPPDLTNQFFNEKTIYSDLIEKLDELELVEPLNLEVSPRSLDTVLDVADAYNWDTNRCDEDYKRQHPYVVLRMGNILVTSVMLVFKKIGP